MFTPVFWRDALERVIRTAAQTLVAVLTADSVGLFDVDWVGVGSTVGLAAVLSLATSIAASGAGDAGTAGLVSLRETPPAPRGRSTWRDDGN